MKFNEVFGNSLIAHTSNDEWPNICCSLVERPNFWVMMLKWKQEGNNKR